MSVFQEFVSHSSIKLSKNFEVVMLIDSLNICKPMKFHNSMNVILETISARTFFKLFYIYFGNSYDFSKHTNVLYMYPTTRPSVILNGYSWKRLIHLKICHSDQHIFRYHFINLTTKAMVTVFVNKHGNQA